MGVHGVHPEAMTAHLQLYAELMFAPSEQTRAERETVAVAVSRANHCFYCITHHGAALRRLARDDVLVDALAADPDGTPLARGRAPSLSTRSSSRARRTPSRSQTSSRSARWGYRIAASTTSWRSLRISTSSIAWRRVSAWSSKRRSRAERHTPPDAKS